MPHAKDEIGTYKVRVTVKNNNPAYPNLAFTDVLTIVVEESLMIQFKNTIQRFEVRVGEKLEMDLPALYNPNDMDHKFSILSQPAWSTFRNDKFIFEPDLDEFLQGVIKIGTYEVSMSWNAKSSQDFSGSFLGVENLGASTLDFYQPHVFEVVLVEQSATLEL